MRPAIYCGDGWVVWTGGYSRRLTLWERFLWRIGKLKTVKP